MKKNKFDASTSFERKLRIANDIMNDKKNDLFDEEKDDLAEEATLFAKNFYHDLIMQKAEEENLNELIKTCEIAVAEKLRFLSPEQRSKSKENNYKDLLKDIPEHHKINRIFNQIKDITPDSTELVFQRIDKELTKQRSEVKQKIEELKLTKPKSDINQTIEELKKGEKNNTQENGKKESDENEISFETGIKLKKLELSRLFRIHMSVKDLLIYFKKLRRMYNLALFNLSDIDNTTESTVETAENLIREMEYSGILKNVETHQLLNKIRGNLMALDVIHGRADDPLFSKHMDTIIQMTLAKSNEKH